MPDFSPAMSEQPNTQSEATPAPLAQTTNAVAVREDVSKMDSRQLLASNYLAEQVSKALPEILTPKRFMRVTLTAFNKNPKLWECSKASIASVILQTAQWGLEPDGRNAHIVPYNNKQTGESEAQLQLDYKGLVALVRRSGEVASLHADVVCEADEFDYNLGEIQTHRIDFKRPRGNVYAVYATARLKDGSTQSVVMTKDEVDAIAARSRSVQAAKKFGKTTPWDTDWSEMAKKTAFRRLTKWLPLTAEVAKDAIEHDSRLQRQEFGDEPIDVTPAAPRAEQPKSLAAKILAAPAKKPKAQPKKPEPEPTEEEPTDDYDGV